MQGVILILDRDLVKQVSCHLWGVWGYGTRYANAATWRGIDSHRLTEVTARIGPRDFYSSMETCLSSSRGMMVVLCSSVVHDDRSLACRPDPMLASDMTLAIRAIVVDALSGGGQLDPGDGIGST